MASKIESFKKKIEGNRRHIEFFGALKSIPNPENLPKNKFEAALFYYASTLGLNPKSATSDYLQTLFSVKKRKVYGVYYEGGRWLVNSVKNSDRYIEKGAAIWRKVKSWTPWAGGTLIGNGWVVGSGPTALTNMIKILQDKSKNSHIFHPRQQNKYVRNKAYDVATILEQGARAFTQLPALQRAAKKRETKQVIEKAVAGIMDTRKRVILSGLSQRAIHSQQVSLQNIPASITYSQVAFTLYYLAILNNPGEMSQIRGALQPKGRKAMNTLAAVEYLRNNYFRERNKQPFWWDKDNKRWYYRGKKPIALGLTPTALISISEKLNTDAARGNKKRGQYQKQIKLAQSLFDKINGLKQTQQKEAQKKKAAQERANQTSRLIQALPYAAAFTARFPYKYLLETDPAFKEKNNKFNTYWAMLKLDDTRLLAYNGNVDRYVAFENGKWAKATKAKATELIKKYYGIGKFQTLTGTHKKLVANVRKLNTLAVASGKFSNEQTAGKVLATFDRPQMAGTFTFATLNHGKLRTKVKDQVKEHYQKHVLLPIAPGVRSAVIALETKALYGKLQQTIETARKSKKYKNTDKLSYTVKKDGTINIVKGAVAQAQRPSSQAGTSPSKKPLTARQKAKQAMRKAAEKATKATAKMLGPFRGMGTFVKSHWNIASEQINKAQGWKAKLSTAASYFFTKFIPSAGKASFKWASKYPVHAAGVVAAPIVLWMAVRKWRRYLKRLRTNPKTPRPKISIPGFVKAPVRAIINILPKPVRKGLVGMLGAGVVVGLGMKTASGRKAARKISRWGEGRWERLRRAAVKKYNRRVDAFPDKKTPLRYNHKITKDWTVDKAGISVPKKGYMYIETGSVLYVRQSNGTDRKVNIKEAYALIRKGSVTFAPTKTIFKAGTVFYRGTRKLHPRKRPRN